MTTRLAVVVGSTRPDRFAPTAARWFADVARKHDDVEVDVVDLADHDVPVAPAGNDPAAGPPDGVRELGERLRRADAFVVVTPTYNRSFSAVLKAAIDWFYAEWSLKPVGFVSYGGASGGHLPIEQLRSVFTEFNAVPLKDAVVLREFWTEFDHDGRPVDRERLARWASPLVEQLTWWSATLRAGLAERPYPGTE